MSKAFKSVRAYQTLLTERQDAPSSFPTLFERKSVAVQARLTFNYQEIEMKGQLWLVALLAALTIPNAASAQRLERTKLLEVGDKLTYTYVLKGASLRAVEEVIEVTDTEIRIKQDVGSRTYAAVISTRDMSRVGGICIANSQACSFSPGERWVDFPLEIGRTWSNTFVVTGETFVAEDTQERTVEGVEKIRTPAGEFLAYRVASSGRGAWWSKFGAGQRNHFTETATYWWTAINGKLVLVKQEYESSSGARSSRELVSVQLQ